MTEPTFTFGHFVFDARRHVLERDGVAVALPNKALALLALLLREAGTPVSKERIYETVWGDKAVEDGNLTQTVYVLRRALSNGAPGRTMIRTVPQVGYEFVEPVEVLGYSPERGTTRIALALTACVLAALLAAGFIFSHLLQLAPASAEALLPTPALKAYELGRESWNKPTRASGLRARRHFERVVKLAPSNPLGYAGLSDAYLLLSGQSPMKEREHLFKMAQYYAKRALAIDPASSEAHASNAQALYHAMKPGAREEFERAIALNPRNALAHRWYGEYWIMNGHFGRGADELSRSNAIQPLVAQDVFWLGVAQYYDRRYDASVESFRETLAAGGDAEPEVGLHLALAYEAAGNTPAALRELNRLQRALKDPPDVHAVRASILAMHGDRSAALKEIAPLLHARKGMQVSAVSVAVTLARAGKPGEARRWLRAHHTHPDETSIFPVYDPRLAGLQLGPLPPSAV